MGTTKQQQVPSKASTVIAITAPSEAIFGMKMSLSDCETKGQSCVGQHRFELYLLQGIGYFASSENSLRA
jgi:hypothetical protein